MINCNHRLILTVQGQRTALSTVQTHINQSRRNHSTSPSNNRLSISGRNLKTKHSSLIFSPSLSLSSSLIPMKNQKLIVNVPFDCKGRIDGHWRDTRYCDIFHACLAGEQKRSYGCNQIGERFYFDDVSQK
jgi:hypothetical protein